MTTYLVDRGWKEEVRAAIEEDSSELRLVSPFVKLGATKLILSAKLTSIRLITRFNLADFAEGVSDISALRYLLANRAVVRGVKNLHSKLYLFGAKKAIITSANLTEAALSRNHEFGVVSNENEVIASCHRYFDHLWERGGANLTTAQLDQWEKTVLEFQIKGARSNSRSGLADFGSDIGTTSPLTPSLPAIVADSDQAFVKFLGEGDNRVPLSFATIDEINRAGCHWAVAYPASKRPRAVKDGAIIFIGRLTHDPNDIRVFGRAIGMCHVEGRDDATSADIALRPWKEDWPRYVRVHHVEFVAGSMKNGVSLNHLMDALGENSFASTKRNAVRGEGNIDPRKAYRQQAAVELTLEGITWLSDRLQAAFDRHGTVAQTYLDELDWPDV